MAVAAEAAAAVAVSLNDMSCYWIAQIRFIDAEHLELFGFNRPIFLLKEDCIDTTFSFLPT